VTRFDAVVLDGFDHFSEVDHSPRMSSSSRSGPPSWATAVPDPLPCGHAELLSEMRPLRIVPSEMPGGASREADPEELLQAPAKDVGEEWW